MKGYRKMKKSSVVLVLVLAAGSLAFAGLGGFGWLDSLGILGEERHLRVRVDTYWQARVEDDAGTIATYEHPLQMAVMEEGLLNTLNYEIVDLVIDGEKAVATVNLRSRLRHPILSPKVREVQVQDRWEHYQGRWYREQFPVGLSDTIRDLQGQWQPPTQTPTGDE